MVKRVIDGDRAADIDREPSRLRKICIANVILRTSAVWRSQVRWPPVARRAPRRGDEQTRRLEAPPGVLLIVVHIAVVYLLLALAVPSDLTLRLVVAAANQLRLVCHQVRQFDAQSLDPTLQVIVKHVRHHSHTAAHPLASTREFGVVELRHVTVTINDSVQHTKRRVDAETVSLCNILDGQLAGRREFSHRSTNQIRVCRYSNLSAKLRQMDQ